MTIARVEEIIEKRFQIKMTRNRSYQILWHSRDERIEVSNIRSDYMIIEIKKGLATLKISFTNERELIKILNAFVNIAGELNRNNKGAREMKAQSYSEYLQDYVKDKNKDKEPTPMSRADWKDYMNKNNFPIKDEDMTTYPRSLLEKRECRCWACGEIVPSMDAMAFFEYRPKEKYDSHYCGCDGWD